MTHESEELHLPGKSEGKRGLYPHPSRPRLRREEMGIAGGGVEKKWWPRRPILHFFRAPFILRSMVPWSGAHRMGHTNHAAKGSVMQ